MGVGSDGVVVAGLPRRRGTDAGGEDLEGGAHALRAGDERAGGVEVQHEVFLCRTSGGGGFEDVEGGGGDGVGVVGGEDVVDVRVVVGCASAGAGAGGGGDEGEEGGELRWGGRGELGSGRVRVGGGDVCGESGGEERWRGRWAIRSLSPWGGCLPYALHLR